MIFVLGLTIGSLAGLFTAALMKTAAQGEPSPAPLPTGL